MFDTAFEQLKGKYVEWSKYSPDQVQEAYFATKKSKEVEVYKDSTERGSKEDETAYDLIMRNKERLLSFEEHVSFIFSHSALNEGWDNPNVFQICILREVKDYATKRQQIGRGVRLAVNQEGNRIYDEHTNVLTVIASETYNQFVEGYQSEIEEIYGKSGAAPKPSNANAKTRVLRQKQGFLSEDFKVLWDKIKHKTRYSVEIETDRVIQEVIDELERAVIKAPRVTTVKAEIELRDDNTFEAVQRTAVKDMGEVSRDTNLPDLVRRIAYLLSFQSPPLSLSRQTILQIILGSQRLNDGIRNPHEFTTVAVRIIKEKLADHLVKGIQYERINEWYEMTQFDGEYEAVKQFITAASKSIYDHVDLDSNVELSFVTKLEERNDVKLYVKLPNWFLVPTPVGNYNPDWAIVMDDPNEPDGEKLYLVRETKGEGELRPTERRKTECGEKHFKDALRVDYRIITDANDLP